MNITFIQVGWLGLFFFQISISFFLFYSYLRTYDKRKIIFGIGFLISSFPHLYNGYLNNVLPQSALLDSIYRWCFYPIVFSLGIAVHQILLKIKNMDKILFSYIIIVLISFLSISFSPLNIQYYLNMIIGLIVLEIIFASIVLTLLNKKITELFLLLSLICLTVGAITISENVSSSIFIFFIGLLYIGFSFILTTSNNPNQRTTVSEYFTLKNQLKKTKSALIESEDNFKRVFNEMVDATAIIDLQGIFLEVSDKLLEKIGYEKQEIKEKNFFTLPLLDEESKRRFMKNISLRSSGIYIPPYKVDMTAKNGITIPFELHEGQITFKGNNVILAVFRDISYRKKIIDSMRETEEKFRSFTENASIALLIYQDDKWIYANPYAILLTGYTKEELIGMDYWELVHPDHKNLIRGMGKEIQHNESAQLNYEFKIISKQGNIKWIDFRANNIKYFGKNAVFVTALDITEKIESQAIMNKQLTVIKSSIDGIAILDQNHNYTYLNQAHANIYGYNEPRELIGKNWNFFIDERELQRVQKEIIPEFQKDGRWRGEVIGKKKDGSTFNQEITLTKLDDGGLIYVVRDITRQKMVLKELQDAHEVLFTINKDLERKVQQRTKEVEYLVKQKDDFINQLGHDLKTPLTPIMVLLPILESKLQSDKDKELFNVVSRNVIFMKELVNKTINLAKLNSNKIEFNINPVLINDEIKNVLLNNNVLFEENDIKIENHVINDIYVEADQIQLQELLNNLITNAVKYSPESGGTISIDVIEENDSDFLTVSIRDTGIGMEGDQIQQAFNEFYKADDSRHNLDSSGLGLNICKRIVEKHGGKIWVESPGRNQGSTFYFTIKKSKQNNIE